MYECFFLPSKRGFYFAKIRGFKVTDYRGIERGRAEGRSAGLFEGEVRGKLAIARKLLASGMSGEQVTEFTGLTAEQLEELK